MSKNIYHYIRKAIYKYCDKKNIPNIISVKPYINKGYIQFKFNKGKHYTYYNRGAISLMLQTLFTKYNIHWMGFIDDTIVISENDIDNVIAILLID